MHIDVIQTREQFQSVRSDWERIYERDPDAQYFLSWGFLSTYMRRFETTWMVLAAREGPPGSPYVALFPLRIRARLSNKRGVLTNEINMAGSYSADYTGLLVELQHERRAIPALVRHLKSMHWAKLHLENLRMSDRRRLRFLESLADPRLTITPLGRASNGDGIDNAICPIIQLPSSWEAYLEGQVSSNTRQKIKRFLRRIDAAEDVQISEVTAETLERDCEILLEMWRVRWEPRKLERMPGLIKSNRLLLKYAFANGQLKLPVLWDKGRAVGALAFFKDPVRGQLLFHMAGRDETYEAMPGGLLLHAHSIRWAITNGYRHYDFMRGNEPYKYGFGPRDHMIHSLIVETKSGKNLGDRLDARTVEAGLRAATKLHTEGELAKAEKIYRQILESAPLHSATLYALGQLLEAGERHAESSVVYGRLTELFPRSVKMLARYAVSLQSAGQYPEAAKAFTRLLEVDGTLAGARYGLARCLATIGRETEALAILNDLKTCDDARIRLKARKQSQVLAARKGLVAIAAMPELVPTFSGHQLRGLPLEKGGVAAALSH